MKPLITLLLAASAVNACPCGCARPTLDNSLEHGLGNAGWAIDLTHATISQDERAGAAHAHIAAHHRLTNLTVEGEVSGARWTLVLPRVERLLTVTATGATTQVSGLGDATLTARVPMGGPEVIAGIKLPTGTSDATLGVPRRYLQPGTGSTDLIAGFRLSTQGAEAGASAFLQITGQAAINTDGIFRPGSTLSLVAGFRQPLGQELAFTLQGSVVRQHRDKNLQASVDPAYAEDLETSILSVSATPGLVWTPNASTSIHLHLTEPLVDKNYAGKAAGGLVNPVHSSRIVSIGVTRRF